MSAYAKLSGEFNPTAPTRVIFGQGKTATLEREVEGLRGKRVLVLSGRTVAEQTDAVSRTTEALGDSVVGVYSGLTQRAPLATAVEAANLAVSLEADTLVGVGGSTVSDAARMIAALMAEGIDNVEELRDRGHREDGMLRPNLDGKALPLQVSIPTTLSAGEFNMGGGNVLDDGEGHKIRGGPSQVVCRPHRARLRHDRRDAGLAVGFRRGSRRWTTALNGCIAAGTNRPSTRRCCRRRRCCSSICPGRGRRTTPTGRRGFSA